MEVGIKSISIFIFCLLSMLAHQAFAQEICKDVSQDGYTGRICGQADEKDEPEQNRRRSYSNYGGTLTGTTAETQGKTLSRNQTTEVTVQLCPDVDGKVVGNFSYNMNVSFGGALVSTVIEGSVNGETDRTAEMPTYNMQMTSRLVKNIPANPALDSNITFEATAAAPTKGDFSEKIGLVKSVSSGNGSQADLDNLAMISVAIWKKADDILQRSYERWLRGKCIAIKINPERPKLDSNLKSKFKVDVVRVKDESSVDAKIETSSSDGTTINPKSAEHKSGEVVNFELQAKANAKYVQYSVEAMSHQGRALFGPENIKLSRWRCVVEVAPGTPLRIVYTSGLGTKSIWTWSFEGDPMFSGSGTFDLTSGSTRYTMTPKATGHGTTARGAIPKTASIGGTDEEPTLILGIDGTAHYTASGEGGSGSVAKNVTGQRTFKLEEIE